VANRWKDWFAQAERDLEHARESRSSGRHEWSCFASHQAAEKAVKALHLGSGQEAWGQVVARLLTELPAEEAAPAKLIEKARVLDAFYVPTRNPHGHPEGAPFQHYGDLQSEEATRYAGEIVEFARTALARRARG
jgi:HEPN domain-containing protein